MSCLCRLLLTYLFPALLLHGESRGGGGRWRWLSTRRSRRVGAPRAAETSRRGQSPSRQLRPRTSRACFLLLTPESGARRFLLLCSAQSPSRLDWAFWKGADLSRTTFISFIDCLKS